MMMVMMMMMMMMVVMIKMEIAAKQIAQQINKLLQRKSNHRRVVPAWPRSKDGQEPAASWGHVIIFRCQTCVHIHIYSLNEGQVWI